MTPRVTDARASGPPGNERLTASVGLILLVLLALESSTTLSLHSLLSVHIFLGLLLLPLLALKLASTGWRFLRYYAGSRPYRLKGPPRLFLRLLAPLLVASTLTLFGSGVALIVAGDGELLLNVHAVSFYVWGALIIVHVLAYLARTLRIGPADWLPNAELVVAGARSRRAALAGTAIPSAKQLSVVVRQVTNGGGGMPSFGGTLSQQQIADVAAFVTRSITK